jgi:hypothetical protein
MAEKRIYYCRSALVFLFTNFSNKLMSFVENTISEQQKQFTVVVQHQFTPQYVPLTDIFMIFVSEAVVKRSRQPFLTTVLKVNTGTISGFN